MLSISADSGQGGMTQKQLVYNPCMWLDHKSFCIYEVLREVPSRTQTGHHAPSYDKWMGCMKRPSERQRPMNVARNSLIALMYFTGWFLWEAIMLNWSWENEGGLRNGNCNFGFKCNANQNEEYCFSLSRQLITWSLKKQYPLIISTQKKEEKVGEKEKEAWYGWTKPWGPQKLKTELILWIPI